MWNVCGTALVSWRNCSTSWSELPGKACPCCSWCAWSRVKWLVSCTSGLGAPQLASVSGLNAIVLNWGPQSFLPPFVWHLTSKQSMYFPISNQSWDYWHVVWVSGVVWVRAGIVEVADFRRGHPEFGRNFGSFPPWNFQFQSLTFDHQPKQAPTVWVGMITSRKKCKHN